MNYLGDFKAGQTVIVPWESSAASGASANPSANGTLVVYKDDNTTESTAGLTSSIAFDGVAGVHVEKIDLSADGTFYAAGHDFTVVRKTMTIDGVTVSAVVGVFSIENRNNKVDVTKLNGDATAAGKFAKAAKAALSGTVVSGTNSTTHMTTDVSITSDLNGAIIYWTSGGLTGTRRDVTGYTSGAFDFAATSVAPQVGDTFDIF